MDCTSPVFGIYPCGKCLNCRARSRQEWVFRLRMEYESCNFGLFATLTYDEDHLPPDGVSLRDCQLFIKRLRTHFNSQALRYFLVSEYGDHTFRPHYHALLFFQFDRKNDIYDIIEQSWQNGNVQFGDIEEGSIVYCTKYCLKGSQNPPGKNENFRLLSKMNGGIGVKYIYDQPSEDLSEPTSARLHGYCAPMPRYYREKQLAAIPEDERINIRTLYQQKVLLKRDKRLQKELKSYAKKHPDLHPIFAEIDFFKWKEECNKRKGELAIKRTKKQSKW